MAAAGDDKGSDFYDVLGLNKECTSSELRNAYKKLAMRWHPDRCSASGNPNFLEEAKKKFQAIQEAYSVLSDENKRFLYDVGVYDNDDDENGMGEFLNEMADMMSQTKPNENGEDSFEQLKQLFGEMFNGDVDLDGFGSRSATFSSPSSSTSFASCESSSSNNKRTSVEMNFGKGMSSGFDPQFQSFSFGKDQNLYGCGIGINRSSFAITILCSYQSFVSLRQAGHPRNQRMGNGVKGEIPGGRGGSRIAGKKIYPSKASYHYELDSTDWKRRKKG